jgi:hypothetical protein
MGFSARPFTEHGPTMVETGSKCASWSPGSLVDEGYGTRRTSMQAGVDNPELHNGSASNGPDQASSVSRARRKRTDLRCTMCERKAKNQSELRYGGVIEILLRQTIVLIRMQET